MSAIEQAWRILKDEEFYNDGRGSYRYQKDPYGTEGAEEEPEEEPEEDPIKDAVMGILESAYNELDELAGNTAVIPGREGPEAADVAMKTMEQLRSMIDMLEG